MEMLKRCPLLKERRCIDKECNFMMELKSIDDKGKEIVFWRCALVETPLLLIENAQILRQLLTKEKK